MPLANIQKIYVGGWFQRTTLHLTEIFDFLKGGESPLDFDKKKIKTLRDNLNLESVEIIKGDLDCVKFSAKDDVNVKIYEDGLLVLTTRPDSVKKDIDQLTTYYEGPLSEAFSYIFSLGAPVPKELAGIKTIYPYFIVLSKANKKEIDKLLSDFDQEKYFEIKKDTVEIHRGDKLYIINNLGEKLSSIEDLIEEQIFFREFKGQLHRYLNIHRIIWEKIADVKERGKIKGKDIGKFKSKIEGYSKTINLIDARISQMGVYVGTRKAIAEGNKDLDKFEEVLDFKYDTLSNTLSYVKDIWGMTKSYVDSANSLFGDLQSQSTEKSVNNLAIITSMGVGATLIGLFVEPSVPQISILSVIYFFVLATIGFSVDKIIKKIYLNRNYEISDTKIEKDIK